MLSQFYFGKLDSEPEMASYSPDLAGLDLCNTWCAGREFYCLRPPKGSPCPKQGLKNTKHRQTKEPLF